MVSGNEIVGQLQRMGVSHVAWLPDSTLGTWEEALTHAAGIQLVRVCREGEAWAIAAGLHLAGARPVVMIQCTGLFESGDSLRNAIHDYGLPLFAVIGYRSYLNRTSTPYDTARTYTEPTLKAWDLPYHLIDSAEKLPELGDHYLACRAATMPGVALIAEGRM